MNYEQLQPLFDKYKEQGFAVAAFPCNQFGSQEPGTNEEIVAFAQGYGTTYNMYTKIDVNGDNADPLWKFLKSKQGGTLGSFIKWNFTKFLVDRHGVPVKRYAPTTDPNGCEDDIKAELAKSA